MKSNNDTSDICRAIGSLARTIVNPAISGDIINRGILGHLEHMDEILPEGYVDSYRFNLLKRQPETSRVNGKYESLTKTDFEDFQILYEGTCTMNNIKVLGIDRMHTLYNKMLFCKPIDPFFEFIKTIKWDGVPRLRRWFIDGLGAHIPSLSEEDGTFLVEEVTQAWFVGAIKRSTGLQKFEVVPILTSTEQGIGKTTYVQYTSLYGLDPSWYKSTKKSIDDEKEFFESIMGAKIVEWGEAEQLKDKTSAEGLKEFISQEEDTYRESYGHFAESNARRWVPIITSNDTTLFSDTTGNRRFIPFVCDKNRITRRVLWHEMTRDDLMYDVEQVWAEAIVLEQQGCLACIPPRAEELAKIPQQECMRSNDFYDELYEMLDLRHPKVGEFISNKDLKDLEHELFDHFPEMRNRVISSVAVCQHHPKEWKVYAKNVSDTDGERVYKTKRRGILRIAVSPRLETIYDKDENKFMTKV